MNEINNYNNIHFGSINNPVKPFVVKAGKETLSFHEINYKKPGQSRLLGNLAKFFLDNFANTSSHPFWAKCRKPTMDKGIYKDYLNGMTKIFKQYMSNPDATVMLARGKDHKIAAAITTRPVNENKIVKDKDTLYIDCLAVDKKLRGNHVGEQLLNNAVKSTGEKYSDSFVVAYKESEPFYIKQGYRNLEDTNSGESKIINGMKPDRIDYPQYASFMTKPIDESKSRWYNRV